MNGRWPETLPCGYDMAELIVQVADGVPGDLEHQATCEHCQAALADLQQLWDATAALAATVVTAPEGMDRVVMRRVRRALFAAQLSELIGGVVPRLSRALLVYTGLLGGGDQR